MNKKNNLKSITVGHLLQSNDLLAVGESHCVAFPAQHEVCDLKWFLDWPANFIQIEAEPFKITDPDAESLVCKSE